MEEQARYNGFQLFVGKDFSQWAELVSIPAPTHPWVYFSGARRSEGRFSFEMNDAPSADFSLWRSTDLNRWEALPGAELRRNGFTFEFTDPAPPAERAFYEVRR